MGVSLSKNIATAATEAIAKVSNNIVQNVKLSTDQTQIISVSDVDGDVVISGNTFTQKAAVNIKSLMNTLIQEDIQQALAAEMAQACKSIVSGLNLFQVADAQNQINLLVKASIELINTVSQTCMSSIEQTQVITITRVKGSVYIQGNLSQQFADILGSCVQDAVSKNSILQNLQARIDQSAASTAIGLDIWQLVVLVLIVMGIPVVAVIGGVAVAGRYLFPLSVAAGIGCLVAWRSWTEETIYSHAFSPLIKYTETCVPQSKGSSVAFASASAAAQACKSDATCKAFDWQGAIIGADGSSSAIQPQTTFYSDVGSICESSVKSSPDRSSLLRMPKMAKGRGPPGRFDADVYLDVETTNYYFLDLESRQWQKQGSFAHSGARSQIDWGTSAPAPTSQGVVGSLFVVYSATNPIYFHVYVKNPDGWKLTALPFPGPGLIANASSNINVSGFTTIQRKQWLVNIGIAFLTIGVLGSAKAFKK